MGIKYFNIEYDREVFYPGQMVSGRVRLSLDKPKELKGVEITLSGKAKCHWTKRESYTDSEGKSQSREVSCDGKETYMKTKLTLVGGGSKFELPIGDHVYPFTVTLPAPLPPTYSGTYGGISYYGKAKLDLPWALDKSEKKHFLVESPIDLNKMPELNKPYKNEKSKTFCCWCCASGPLTVSVHIPRTGFAYTDVIPITLEVENASNVEVNSVKIELNQKISWKATNDSKEEKTAIKKHKLGSVGENASQTWTQEVGLGPDKYPNTGNCGIIRIKYELEIELDAKGPHSDLELKIPVTIGTIPYGGSLPEPMNFGPPPQQVPPPTGFGYNPDPIGFAPTYPPNAGDPYGGGPPANLGPSYPGNTGAPYPGPVAAPYPGGAASPYPGAGGAAPYPGAVGTPYPGAAGMSYPGNTGAPYPGGTPQPYPGAPNPSATSTPNAAAPYSQPAYAPVAPQEPHMYPDQFPLSEPQVRALPDAPAETNPLLENK